MTYGVKPITYLCSQLVSITVGEPERNQRVMLGNLEEIDHDRAVVLLDAPVAKGAEVVVKAQKTALHGHASRWSFVPALGYFVDVRLSEHSRWTMDGFRPEYLLEVPAMAA
ncbi:MAG: hypothetical protein JST93_17980 [Acidobacteria bacterium]|nr:hypothetical protein [Acidobacteriota bacterium]